MSSPQDCRCRGAIADVSRRDSDPGPPSQMAQPEHPVTLTVRRWARTEMFYASAGHRVACSRGDSA
eukprot:3762865-Rhodomonas_salina.1